MKDPKGIIIKRQRLNKKLTNIEKGDLNNTLYEYKRAVTSKRQTLVRNNLHKLVEQILNAKRI